VASSCAHDGKTSGSIKGGELVRFQVPTATSMKMTVIWDVAPCSLVEIVLRFRGAYCIHHQGKHNLLYFF
jgi:hypothetical protein